jgi:tetratricopeptide (TPR) repeat protein
LSAPRAATIGTRTFEVNPPTPDEARPDIIVPRAFGTGEAPAPGAPGGHSGARALALAAAAVVLLGGVMVVVLVLPHWMAPTAPSGEPPLPAATTAAPAPGFVPPAPDPIEREHAQQVLAGVLETLGRLERLAVDTWDRSGAHRARGLIADGEKAYREARYDDAETRYAEARAALEALEASVPEAVAALVDRGRLALANGDSAGAAAAFEQALAMDPENAAAAGGRARAATLDQVLALTQEAEGHERMGDRERALSAYREAVALDAEAEGAQAAMARIERDQRADALDAAMSQGFAALERGDYGAARSAFERAARIDGNDPAVKDALRQAENAAIAAAIERHLALATRAERAEAWAEAERQYALVLEHDERLPDAERGRARAAERKQLDERLEAYLERPERLSDDAVHAEASALLERVRGLGDGARLRAQRERLAEALRLAHLPIAVLLTSDGETRVSVARVGELGRFEQRRLELRPGTYTAHGRRDGYRDVRVEFTLVPTTPAPSITIQCDEKLAFGS